MKKATMKFVIANLCRNGHEMCETVGLHPLDLRVRTSRHMFNDKGDLRPFSAVELIDEVAEHLLVKLTAEEALAVLSYAAKIARATKEKAGRKEKKERAFLLDIEQRKRRCEGTTA